MHSWEGVLRPPYRERKPLGLWICINIIVMNMNVIISPREQDETGERRNDGATDVVSDF